MGVFLDRIEEYQLSTESLSIFRIFFCLFSLFIIGIHNFTWLGPASDLFFDPVLGLSSLFSGFPSNYFFTILSLILILLFCLLLFGIYTTVSSYLITITLIVGNSFKYSLGKIDHDILFVLCPALLAISGWGNHYTLFKRRDALVTINFPAVQIIAILLAFGMSTSALIKLWTGWLDFDVWAVKGMLVSRYYTTDHPPLLIETLLHIDSVVLWKAMDYAIVLIEGAMMITLFIPRLFRLNITFLIVFHLVNSLVIHIPFISLLPCYLLFLDWEGLKRSDYFNQIIRIINKLMSWQYGVLIAFLAGIQWIIAVYFNLQGVIFRPTYFKMILEFCHLKSEALIGAFAYGFVILLIALNQIMLQRDSVR